MRRAKIVCTIGPASSDEATIEALIRAGMNVARLNFSHGSHDDHRGVYETVRRVAQRLDTPVAILQDLQGPKMRVGTFAGGEATLVEGQRFRLVTDEVEGDSEQVSLGHRDLVHDVRAGEEILLDDGLLRLKVEHVDETGIEDARQSVGQRNLVHLYRRFERRYHLVPKRDIAFAAPDMLAKGGWAGLSQHLWPGCQVMQVGPQSLLIDMKHED